jgi:ABC-type uncharacterized transport system fused permease/ATPase subunit
LPKISPHVNTLSSSDTKTATRRILEMVWPNFFAAPGAEGTDGRGWVVAMAALVGGQTWLMARVATTHSALNAAIHSTSGNSTFTSLLYTNIALAFGQTFFKQTLELVVSRLALVWRTKLTHLLHGVYFRDNNYYHLVHQGNKMADPDQRIAHDVMTTTDGMSQCLVLWLKAVATGMYFTVELARQMGPFYAVLPYVFLFSGFYWTDKVCPLDWRR